MNLRPVPVDISGSNGEPSLQSVLPGIDVVNDQITAAAFSSGSGWSEWSVEFVVEYAGFASNNFFGIYAPSETVVSIDELVPLFRGSDTAGDVSATASFSGGDLTIGSGIHAVVYEGFGDDFGFWIGNPKERFLYFSEDSRNRGGAAQALIFETFDPHELVVAFEDVPYGVSDRDFNDLVVRVGAAAATPEPGAFVLFVTGFAVVSAAVRRRPRA